jgi:DNA invertase Pin-like site-specific DNA recombinase
MANTPRKTGIYARVSTRQQELRSQLPDLQRWVGAYAGDVEVVWYTDKASGSSMERPAWRDLEAAYRTGEVDRVVVWRLDRLGRTSSGLTALFDELRRMGVALVSVREGFDLATPAGAMVATIIASVAQHETEVRRERQAAGIAAAKAQGKRWGGRKAGARYKVTPELERQVKKLHRQGESIAAIARAAHLSRPTVYTILG